MYLAEMSTGSGFVKNVAVKVLREDIQEHEQVAARLRDEAKLLGMLRHPSIVQADDLINLAGRPAVVMEYVPGVNLSWLIDPRRCATRMPPGVAFAIARHVASALDAAYARPSDVTGRPLGVLHRDIKPGNVRITADGAVKVLDFGIARSEHKGRETDTKDHQLGTLHYMSPELMAGQPASPASDIYALGVVLFEALARRRLGWASESKASHDVHVRTRLEQADLPAILGAAWTKSVELLGRLLAHDPSRRPTAAEAARGLRELEGLHGGPSIDQWVSQVLPSVVLPDVSQDADLSGKVLFEESSFVSPTDSFPLEEATTAPTAVEPASGGRGRLLLILAGVATLGVVVVALGLGVGWILLFGPSPGQPASPPVEAVNTAETPPVAPPVEPVVAPEPEVAPREREPAPSVPRSPMPAAATSKPPTTAPLAHTSGSGTSSSTPSPQPRPEAQPAPPPAVPTTVRFSSVPFGLEVRLNGAAVGTTPLTVELAPGVHVVAFGSGDSVISRDIEVVAGEENIWTYNSTRGDIR